MKKISHSKYRNTGLIFELLIHQISIDTLKNQDSPALDVMKKYFIKTELGREYKIYESLIKKSNISEGKANILIDTLIEYSKNSNKKLLKSLKYNLIKDINENYNIDDFFNIKVPHYKELAAVYNLLEIYNSTESYSPDQVVYHKNTILEHLTKPKNSGESSDNLIKEFKSYDNDLRILTYKSLLEKFNSKYDSFSSTQKQILKEFINSSYSNNQLREFYNGKITQLKSSLNGLNEKIADKTVQIKINEALKYIDVIPKNTKLTDENLVDLLQYSELNEELLNLK
jgi:hypothetical protein